MTQRVVVFDGDDTLWDTMPLYTNAKRLFYGAMDSFGFDVALVPDVFERFDLENLAKFGFGRERFPTSMVDTYRYFCAAGRRQPERAAEQMVWTIGDSVFEGRPAVFPEATGLLERLRGRFKLVLMTKGDEAVQHQRIVQSGLISYFDSILIVPTKGKAEFQRVLEKQYVSPARNCWSVGNSLKSDINPALETGLSAIWIPYHTWDAEADVEMKSERLYKVDSLLESLPILQREAGC
jgi:putative hydrolase of the HAD superfamily